MKFIHTGAYEVGTEAEKQFEGRTIRLTVVEVDRGHGPDVLGFETGGRVFYSLSAAAAHYTGRPTDGRRFWGAPAPRSRQDLEREEEEREANRMYPFFGPIAQRKAAREAAEKAELEAYRAGRTPTSSEPGNN